MLLLGDRLWWHSLLECHCLFRMISLISFNGLHYLEILLAVALLCVLAKQ